MFASSHQAVVSILDENHSIAGSGFLISYDLIITCAHVISTALNQPIESRPKQLISLKFPLYEPLENQLLEARVVFWLGEETDTAASDIAILSLTENLDLQPSNNLLDLTFEELSKHRPFEIFGFNTEYGTWATGDIAGPTADKQIQLNVKENSVEHGFSGAPVWDSEQKAIIGMVTSSVLSEQRAYMLPISVIMEKWPSAENHRLNTNPYRGLFAFEECHQSFYFGREALIASTLSALEYSPLVIIAGASGSGKSSLMNAGVIPEFKRRYPEDCLIKFRPLNDPFKELSRVFVDVLYNDPVEKVDKTLFIQDTLIQHPGAVSEFSTQLLNTTGAEQLLIVIDQFEELFTATTDIHQRYRFLDVLIELVNTSTNFKILISVRADFFSILTSYSPMADVINQYSQWLHFLKRMSNDELQAAIEKPAELSGARLEVGLAERIIEEMGDESGQLPLLQFALTRLWEMQTRGTLTHASLNEIGGISKALTRYAEDLLHREFRNDQEAIKRIMLQLVMPGAGTEDTRHVASIKSFSSSDQQLIPRLSDARLVVTGIEDNKGSNDTVEVIHEALIREWQTLKTWLSTHRAFREWQNRFRDRMRDWQGHDKEDELLLIGRFLSEAEDYEVTHGDHLSEEDRQYISKSLHFRDVKRKRERQRDVLIKVLASVLFMVSFSFSIISYYQLQQARAAQHRAEEHRVEAQKSSQQANKLKVEAEKERDNAEKAREQLQLANEKSQSMLAIVQQVNDKLKEERRKYETVIKQLDSKDKNAQNLQKQTRRLTAEIERLEHSQFQNVSTNTAIPPSSADEITLAKLDSLIKQKKWALFKQTFQHWLMDDTVEKAVEHILFFADSLLTTSGTTELLEFVYLAAEEQAKIEQWSNIQELYFNIASYYRRVNKHVEKASKYYKKSTMNSQSSRYLKDFATFAYKVVGDNRQADELFKLAINTPPYSASVASAYAIFLHTKTDNYEEALQYYELAYSKSKVDRTFTANHLANFSQLLLASGQKKLGHDILQQALIANNQQMNAIQLELLFYKKVHFSLSSLERIQLENMLNSGVRSYGWNFEPTLKTLEEGKIKEELTRLSNIISGSLAWSKTSGHLI